jgi:dihydropteroate synthase
MFLQCGSKALDLSRPQVMGILNVTPDSFSDGGQWFSGGSVRLDHCLRAAEQMVLDGATLLDIGGESTRPGALSVSSAEEMDRVLPIVEAIAERIDTVISVDTSNPDLIAAAAKKGAGLINDVRALQREGALRAAVQTGLPVCLMHMQGEPGEMQKNPQYGNVTQDVCHWLLARAKVCEAAGIAQHNIVLDPGFGFGKTLEHNLVLLRQLEQLATQPYLVLVGLSRKSMIGAITGREVRQRLAGSLALAQLALERGAQILRVHDVAETADMVKMWCAVKTAAAL